MMKRRNATASSSKQPVTTTNKNSDSSASPSPSDERSVYLPQPVSPRKRANTIKSSQKAKLKEIEKRCLITNEPGTKASIQACHIVRRNIIGEETAKLEKMWGMDDFCVDSTKNLVTLRADWHLAYDANAWAFVPTQTVIDKIENAPLGNFDRPYKGYKAKAMTNYVFVSFPELGLNYINRADFERTSFKTYWADNNFDGFPILKHHSHPYFVIYNALPKLRANADILTGEQQKLYHSMARIYARWNRKLRTPPAPGKGKRKRDGSDEEATDRDTDHEKTGKRTRHKRPRGPTTKTKTQPKILGDGQDKSGKQTRQLSVLLQSLYPTPPGSLGRGTFSYHDRIKAIPAWVKNVSTAGPLEQAPISVVLDDGEAVRPGLADWHEWGVPWTPPAHHSMATSNDWAIMECGKRLTKPLTGYYPEESMHSSYDS